MTVEAVPRWKLVLFSALTAGLFFLLVEAALALFGVSPQLRREDPFVGFVAGVPLFVEGAGAGGEPVWVTATGKRGFFNLQQFARRKPPGTHRLFCLGGSTTYGRPYADATSFCGWLRELLPAADPTRSWEVVNAGGISYASYRAVRLMEELVRYEPDHFVVYTGHNEFLEERTYGELRDLPAVVKSAAALLADTRIWTAAESLYDRIRPVAEDRREARSVLPSEVRARLDHSVGPADYERDGALRRAVVEHFRFSLRRMVRTAGQAGADVTFVTPASNLKDCSPFKSQHTAGLDDRQRARAEALLAAAAARMAGVRWGEALELLDEALTFDPRFAELHYRRGRALFALERAEEAEAALVRARDEDVCPLRAPSPVVEAVAEVAVESGVPSIDFADLVARRTRSEKGHGIAGEELFLDHVHPTIAGHRLLALALIDAWIERGTVRPGSAWGERAVAEVAARVEGAIDDRLHARALANVALTFDWAGKKEESRRLALRALESGEEDPTILMIAARHLAIEGRSDEGLELFRRAMRANPNNPVVHSQLGMLLVERGELEAATAHFFLASILWADNDFYHQQLGSVLSQRGVHGPALRAFLEADRLNPGRPRVEARIAALRAELGGEFRPAPVEVSATRYASGYPRTIAQARPGSGGTLLDGIWTRWYDGGQLEAFADYADGALHGTSVRWDENGTEVERRAYRRGRPVS